MDHLKPEDHLFNIGLSVRSIMGLFFLNSACYHVPGQGLIN